MVVTGCGLPTGSEPVEVATGDVPYGLLNPANPSPTPSLTPGVALVPATIYLADTEQRLVAVPVEVPSAPLLPVVQTLLNRLAVGPSDRERALGLQTDLGPGSTIVLRSVSNRTASIELQPTNQDPSPSKLPIAVGQIVLTATSVVGIDRVVFERDGQLIPVPGPVDGARTSEPLLADYYATLLAPGQQPVQRLVPMTGSGTTGTPGRTTTTAAAPG